MILNINELRDNDILDSVQTHILFLCLEDVMIGGHQTFGLFCSAECLSIHLVEVHELQFGIVKI